MNNSDVITLFLAVTGALAATVLFLVGLWDAIFSPRGRTILTRLAGFLPSRDATSLGRAEHNPLLPPSERPWENEAVLNPAAVRDNDTTHLFYRAIGSDGVSRLGYASSRDGVHIDERLPFPVFAHANLPTPTGHRYDPGRYGSGGSWSGVEDPRAVMLNDRMYLTYNSFNGWDAMRVALTSITKSDLAAKRWHWTPPVYLSPAGERHKNWTLFPEKIFGKFALLHNLHAEDPMHVRIEYIDDPLSFDASRQHFTSPDPNALPDHPIAWHRRMRSIGPPPVKTSQGWLVLYHAMDRFNSSHYKVGAMLLDLADPSRVIARLPHPVLSPEASYEQSGAKPGIVYACGATTHNDQLTVYYGSADTVACSAATQLSTFLEKIVPQKPVPALAVV